MSLSRAMKKSPSSVPRADPGDVRVGQGRKSLCVPGDALLLFGQHVSVQNQNYFFPTFDVVCTEHHLINATRYLARYAKAAEDDLWFAYHPLSSRSLSRIALAIGAATRRRSLPNQGCRRSRRSLPRPVAGHLRERTQMNQACGSTPSTVCAGSGLPRDLDARQSGPRSRCLGSTTASIIIVGHFGGRVRTDCFADRLWLVATRPCRPRDRLSLAPIAAAERLRRWRRRRQPEPSASGVATDASLSDRGEGALGILVVGDVRDRCWPRCSTSNGMVSLKPKPSAVSWTSSGISRPMIREGRVARDHEGGEQVDAPAAEAGGLGEVGAGFRP